MKYGLGLVIGKFYPPHRGLRLLIDAATAHSEQAIVIVCAKPTDTIPGELRGRWLQEIHPDARVMVIDDRMTKTNPGCGRRTRFAGWDAHQKLSSLRKTYGDRYAELMGSKHIVVDKPRGQVPISGTAVRQDPYAHWEFLEPPVRAWFAKRVCVLAAESTGTTTLAKGLADQLQTAWVEEYGREYSEVKLAQNDPDWRTDEFTRIAGEQSRREDAAAGQANRVLICDTNAFATILWHRRYMGSHIQAVEEIARRGRCDLYLLTGDDIPFVQDGLRDGEHIRHQMHGWFKEALAAQAAPWHVLRDSHEKRMQEGVRLIQSLFKGSSWSPVSNHT